MGLLWVPIETHFGALTSHSRGLLGLVWIKDLPQYRHPVMNNLVGRPVLGPAVFIVKLFCVPSTPVLQEPIFTSKFTFMCTWCSIRVHLVSWGLFEAIT